MLQLQYVLFVDHDSGKTIGSVSICFFKSISRQLVNPALFYMYGMHSIVLLVLADSEA